MKNSEDPHVRLRERLQRRRSEHRYRTLDVIDEIQSSRSLLLDSRHYLNFSSNDYLNLSNHSYLKEKSKQYISEFGTSSSSSRLVTGTLHIHKNLEERLADLYQKEKALLFSSGFQANSTIFPAITEKADAIIADEFCHNSILTGCRASKANFYRFRHNDPDHLETFLRQKTKEGSQNIWIVTESIFSMDGDVAPLDKVINLKQKYNAKLYVDDAHALGVCGKNGLGLGANYPEIDLLLSTFGKAGGSFGAFAASSSTVIETLINYCSGFIYSTAPPPSVVGSIEAALDLIPEMESDRHHLKKISVFLHSELKKRNFVTSEKPSHILPIIAGDDETVLKQAEQMKSKGIMATAIRPPTVPENRSRFRISLTAAHQKSDCEKLMDTITL